MASATEPAARPRPGRPARCLTGSLSALTTSLQRNLLVLLLASYALAAFWPEPGLALRGALLVDVPFVAGRLRITLPVAMLAFLLFNAGLAVQPRRLRDLVYRPLPLMLGLLVNLTLPVLYIVVVFWLMRVYHPPEVDEVQDLLAGLALVASVPVAGSSTAWAQNAGGDMPLSVGLVLLSTLLTPVTGPLSLACLRPLAVGGYAAALGNLGAVGGGLLLLTSVLLPATAGLLWRQWSGEDRAERVKPVLKPINLVTLLLLNYANAAVALPRLAEDPDWHFLTVAVSFAAGLCLVLFLGGWWLGRLLHVSGGQRVSLTFGLGMTNNGTGLVLASVALGEYPNVVLPILIYNLVQHLVAGVAQRWLRQGDAWLPQ